MNIIFLLFTLFVQRSEAKTSELLSNIISAVFEDDKTICYIHDRTSFELVLNNALLLSDKVVFSYGIDRLRNITTDVFCNGYILGIRDVVAFEEYFANKNKYTFYFKPHRRALILSDTRSKETIMLQFISNLYALDIITVFNLRPNDEVDRAENLLVHSVYKNEALLEWNYNDKIALNTSKFKRYGWVPKFHFDNRTFTFKISIFDCPPFVTIMDDGRVEGTEFKIIEHVVKNWPVKYKIPIRRNHMDLWSKSWKQLEQNSTDIAACSMWYTASQGKTVDFTDSFRQTCVTFLVPKPRLLPDSTFVFQPFQIGVAPSLVLIILLATLCLYFLRRFYEGTKVDAVEVLLHVFKLITGSVRVFKSMKARSVRFLVIYWIYAGIILTVYYQAGLTSILTKPRYTGLINSLQVMADKKVVWVSPSDYFQRQFRASGTDVLVQLANLYEQGDIKDLNENRALVVKILENIFVCDIEDLSRSKRKPRKVLGECFGNFYFGFAMQKNSPYTRIFNRFSAMFNQHGLLNYWYKISIKEAKAQEVLFETYPHLKSPLINLAKLQGIFYFLIVSNFCAVLVFLLEILFYKYSK